MILFFSWNQLRDLVDQKREDINLAHGLQNFHIECNETIVSSYHLMMFIFINVNSKPSCVYKQPSLATTSLFDVKLFMQKVLIET